MQNNSYVPATDAEAQNYLKSYLQDGVGYRVGDASSVPASVIGQAPGLWSFVPNAIIVRTSDMKVVATQETSQTILDFAAITGNIEAEDPTIIDVDSNCEEGDEEASEPNDVPSQASPLSVGTVSGGICNAGDDIYSIDLAGAWTLDLTFTHAVGDLDISLIDAGGSPLTGNEGASSTDNEQLSGEGSALLVVRGYNGSSAPYTLTLSQ